MYSEAEIIEFNSDGTGVWKHWDDLVSIKTDDYPFTYRVQGRRLIISYITFPERYDVLDFRVADGHLILIEDYGLPSEDIEVYNTFSPNKIKQRNKYNDK